MLPADYTERVYAGVLGKMIGVYLGRPFEGWTYERIMAELGEIDRYVHEQRGVPLIVTDDDLSGTFTFIRALEDHDVGRAITAPQIGQSWLNYVLERRTIFWWGGMGNSTEHTAFLRLKHGIPAPVSGSIAVNGKIVAEQIGAQIFIDGWGLVAPGDPELAAELARKAASVSHDGEAIYGAQVIAAMEAQAFVESDRFKLLETAQKLIPANSVISRLVSEIREQYAREPDWRKTRAWIAAHYGYQKYIGGCHMVPNHALILLGLLYGEDDFSRSLMITNTSGWDTDCNSGNIGCLMGIKVGLAGIDASPYDWRGPVADRLLLPTADGGSAITDGAREALRIANIGRALAGEPPIRPKAGARFHFELSGSLQGFRIESNLPAVKLENVPGPARERALALRFTDLGPGCFVRAATPTFVLPEDREMPGYSLYAAPTLYPGQVVRAALSADVANPRSLRARLFLRCYGPDDQPVKVEGPAVDLVPGKSTETTWTVPALDNQPIFEIGVELAADTPLSGTLYLHWLAWHGAPSAVFRRSAGSGELWRAAWVDGVDQWEKHGPAFNLVQNEGRGLINTGAHDWQDYTLSAPLTLAMGKAAGIAVRVQGARRFYALLLCEDQTLRLVKAMENGDRVLGEAVFPWELWSQHELTLSVASSCESQSSDCDLQSTRCGTQSARCASQSVRCASQSVRIRALADGKVYFEIEDVDRPLLSGGVALVVEEGHLLVDEVTVQ